MEKYEEKVASLLGYDSYSKGRNLTKNVHFARKMLNYYSNKNELVTTFWVDSESNIMRKYYVRICSLGDEIIDYSCNCPQFLDRNTCKHVAASLLECPDIIFPNSIEAKRKKAKEFLSRFESSVKSLKVGKVKQKVDVDVEIIPDDLQFKLHVGLNKKYVLNTENKLNEFISCLENSEEYKFGKTFTYNPEIHYISDEDIEIINFLNDRENNIQSYYSYYDRRKYNELSNREFLLFLEKIKSKGFFIDNRRITNIINDFPSTFEIIKDKDDYVFRIKNSTNIRFYYYNKYALYNNDFYIIPKKYVKILDSFESYEVNELRIDKDYVELFKNGLLQNIKNKLEIDNNITDIKISNDPKASFYFDFLEDKITCNLKINYDGEEINYFSKSEIVRDLDYENKCLEELLNYKFIIKNDNLILEDIDDIGFFIDEGLSKLSEKYNVFTSKKMDNTKILNKARIESSFSIGRDGILSYSFNADDIDSKDVSGILTSIKNKKKYYKLKNGDILNIDDSDIQNFGGMINDLNIKLDENGNAIIPKYKAFYIDSLKRKFSNIKTNNSFDMFIDNFNKYKNTKFAFRKNDEELLREYQKDGVVWLYTLYKCDFGGILADEMGLGKSLQAITFIREVIEEKHDAKILIVCPTSLVYNWEKEFDKFGNDLKYVTVHDNKQRRKEVIDNSDKYNIFITSYGLIRNDNDEYEKIDFEVCIIDEAQAIKNYQAGITKEVKKIKAKFKLALTGTPVENSVNELWSIFDFLMPGYLNNIDNFRSTYGIKDIDDNSLEVIKKLKIQVKPFILRRKKIDVIKDLPEKIENNIYLELSLIQKKLYVDELQKTKKEMNDLIISEGFTKARFKILQLLTKLRQICIDPTVKYDNYIETPVKIEQLINMMHDLVNENHKVLIFSSFKSIIDRVEEIFNKENISSYKITGEVPSKRRMELVEKFNNDDTNCFLITLKSGGTGLNLIGADTIIHLDIWWNPQVENQATDRAHRIGQTKNVTVMKLVTKGTIEEKIIELQEKKKILANNLIEGNDDSKIINSLTEKDIKNLLSFSNEE